MHIFPGAFWHLECLHWRLVSFWACFPSLHLFSLCDASLLFHEICIIIPAEFYVFDRVFHSHFNSEVSQTTWHLLSSHARVWTDTASGNYNTNPVPLNGGRALTLSHRAPGIINNPRIVRGICMAIFTRHNYCQREDCNQGMSREGEGRRACPPHSFRTTSVTVEPLNSFRESSFIMSTYFHNTRDDPQTTLQCTGREQLLILWRMNILLDFPRTLWPIISKLKQLFLFVNLESKTRLEL